jgi:hypothetical protein
MVFAAAPDRADGVDHILSGQVVSASDASLAAWAASQCAAFGQQPGAGRVMDRAVHAPAAEQ